MATTDLPDHVRVTDEVKPRREYTITRARYLATPDVFTVLDKPAVRADGTPVPPKYHTTVNAEASKNRKRATTPATAKKAAPQKPPATTPVSGSNTATEPADQTVDSPADDNKE